MEAGVGCQGGVCCRGGVFQPLGEGDLCFHNKAGSSREKRKVKSSEALLKNLKISSQKFSVLSVFSS